MQFWLDTITVATIKDAAERGMVAGITTNPSILSRAKNTKEILSQILDIQPGPIAVQVTATDSTRMIEEGLRIFEFSNRMIVKIPVTGEGLMAIKYLSEKKIPILGTTILYAHQVLLALSLGVIAIAPYFSHMGNSEEAYSTLKVMANMLRTYNSTIKIVLASLKKIEDI